MLTTLARIQEGPNGRDMMSALGHKRICAVQNGMSALPPKADIRSHEWHPLRRRRQQAHHRLRRWMALSSRC